MKDVDSAIANAPMPTADTLRSRTSLPTQVMRFAAINLKMIKIILKGHSQEHEDPTGHPPGR